METEIDIDYSCHKLVLDGKNEVHLCLNCHR